MVHLVEISYKGGEKNETAMHHPLRQEKNLGCPA